MKGRKKFIAYCGSFIACLVVFLLVKTYVDRAKSERIVDYIELRFDGEEIERSREVRYRKDIANINDGAAFRALASIEELVRNRGHYDTSAQHIVDDLMRSATKNQKPKIEKTYRYLVDLEDGYPLVFSLWAYTYFSELALQEDLRVYKRAYEENGGWSDFSQLRTIGELESSPSKKNRSLYFSNQLEGLPYQDQIQKEIVIGSFSYYKKKFLYEDNQSLKVDFMGFIEWLDSIREYLPDFPEYDDDWYDEGGLDSVDKMIVSYMSMFDISLSYDRAKEINPNMHLWAGSFLRGLRVVVFKDNSRWVPERVGFDILDWYFKKINSSFPERGFDTFKNIRALIGYHGVNATLEWLENGEADIRLKKKEFYDAYMSEK